MNKPPEIDQSNRVTKRAWMLGLIWLPFAFVPSVIGLCLGMSFGVFAVVNVACSIVAALGFWRSLIKRQMLKGAWGIGAGLSFFAINMGILVLISVVLVGLNMIVSFQGCCTSPTR